MRAANPDYHKSVFLRRRYGIDIARYEEMLTEQGGVCAICSKPEGNEMRGKVLSLAVDHCHATGVVRALLCSACNTAIGLLNDDAALLAKAQAYVLYHAQSGNSPSLSDRPSGRCTD
jgi:hypothetical protein